MSGLRQSFLEFIRTVGNCSGCHQMPDRSFFYKGKQFPVCARCCGVFLGHLTAVFIFVGGRKLPAWLCGMLMGIMGLDWTVQEIGLKESNNRRRLLTGFCGGLGLFSAYGLIIRKIPGMLFPICKRILPALGVHYQDGGDTGHD